MQSKACLCSLHLPSLPPPPRPFVSHKVITTTTSRRRSFMCASSSSSNGHHHYNDGKLVDENMITLRCRIRKIQMDENNNKNNNDDENSSDWISKWEKKYFANYDSDVCEAVGLLQRMLMDTRPSFAFTILALLMLSMSTSASLLLFNLLHLAKSIM
ncbi:hypothetical protein PIB30_119190 [Stylosanthes scabra]|uniref:Uncharacterized protein n=1 Tax=Stylosanthes scabra TaxID=79078 RepID=A0ABU6X7R4_9FABA|nr:hypothetical protein [Stylosanthes scabra]